MSDEPASPPDAAANAAPPAVTALPAHAEVVALPVATEPIPIVAAEAAILETVALEPAASVPEPQPATIAAEPVVESLATSTVADAVLETPLEPEAEPVAAEAPVAVEEPPPPPPDPKRWYVVKVQSGREDSIRAAIERRIKIEGLEEFVDKVVVPLETYEEVKNGRKYVKKRKKFPGYIVAHVEYNENVLYLFRETSGVGDFVGGSLTRAPQPIPDDEVAKMLDDGGSKDGPAKPKKVQLNVKVGDRVKVTGEGTFKDMEGTVKRILEPRDAKETHQVEIEVTIWGRPVQVTLDAFHVDAL